MATLAARATEPARAVNNPPLPTIPSRSASLIVSSRSRSQATGNPRQPLKFTLPAPSTPTTVPPPNVSPKSRPSLLKRVGRSLSQSRTHLSRRVSGSKPAATITTPSSPSKTTPPPALQVTAPDVVHKKDEHLNVTQGLTRSKGLKVLGRSKSEGKRRAGVATEEERMDELVRRAERSCGASGVGTEAQSGMGSYFWSDALGVCWDGREQVHPDLLSVQPTYSSNADFIPVASRVVYASTLSTFPPRPPLRRLSSSAPPSHTLSPAEAIIAEYRAQYGTLTPSPAVLDPIISNDTTPIPTPTTTQPAEEKHRGRPVGYARSIASDSSSSHAPSELKFTSGDASRASEDSSTSLESMRGESPTRFRVKQPLPEITTNSPPAPSPLAISTLPRFALVDDGPVKQGDVMAGKRQWATFDADAYSETSSVEDWRDCE